MKKICKNCKYWAMDYENDCGIDRDLETFGDGFEIDVTADDESNMQAIFRTGPNFGCIHFTLPGKIKWGK